MQGHTADWSTWEQHNLHPLCPENPRLTHTIHVVYNRNVTDMIEWSFKLGVIVLNHKSLQLWHIWACLSSSRSRINRSYIEWMILYASERGRSDQMELLAKICLTLNVVEGSLAPAVLSCLRGDTRPRFPSWQVVDPPLNPQPLYNIISSIRHATFSHSCYNKKEAVYITLNMRQW